MHPTKYGQEDEHVGAITCVIYHRDYVFSGGLDGMIKVLFLNSSSVRVSSSQRDKNTYGLANGYGEGEHRVRSCIKL